MQEAVRGIKMKHDRDDDDSDTDDSSKKVKIIQTDDKYDDLLTSEGEGNGEDLSLGKPSSEDAQKYLDAKFIKSAVVSFGTILICSYCTKQLTISTAFSHFRNQCKEMMEKSGRMKDYCKAIKTKNKRANKTYKKPCKVHGQALQFKKRRMVYF